MTQPVVAPRLDAGGRGTGVVLWLSSEVFAGMCPENVSIYVAPSMMFVKSDPFDVIPGGGLVAEEALADFGLFHVRDPH